MLWALIAALVILFPLVMLIWEFIILVREEEP